MRLLSAVAGLIALFGAVTPAQAQAMPQCGQVVTVEFTLMGDWSCGNGPALIVGANGVKINLNGHTLSGNPAISMTDVDGTTISDGTIVAVNATNIRFVDAGIRWLSSARVYDWPGSTVTFLRSDLNVWRLFCGVRCHLLDSTADLNQIYADHLVLQGGGSHMPGSEIIAPKRITLLNNTFSGGMQIGVHKPVTGVISGNRFENMRTQACTCVHNKRSTARC